MKTNYLFIFLITIGCIFTACNKDRLDSSNTIVDPDKKIQLRDSKLIDPCDELASFEVNNISKEDNCCTYEIIVRVTNPENRLYVLIDGILEFVASDENIVFNHVFCDDQPHDISIYAYNPESNAWDIKCETITVNCSCQCKGKSYRITEIGKTEEGCCIYNVRASGDPKGCETILNIGENEFLLNKISVNTNIEVCSGEDIIVSLETGGVTCSMDTLTCGCCDEIDVNVEQLGDIDGDTCCEFQVQMTNNSGCSQSIFSPNGAIIVTVLDGGTFDQVLEQCPEGQLSYTYSIGEDYDNICTTFNLTAVCIESCCNDVTSTVTNLGDTDNDGCCEFNLNIQNGDNCTKILKNGKGFIAATISPGGTYNTIFGSCFDEPWVGQWKLYDTDGNLCEEYDMSEVCTECCEGVDLSSELISSGHGCCTYELTAINHGECDIIFFHNFETIDVLSPGSTFSQAFTVCDQNSSSFFVGETLNQYNSCAEVDITADCLVSCCDDVISTLYKLGDTNGDGCCEFYLDIQNGNNCTKILRDGKGNLAATIPPGGSYNTNFFNCLDEPYVGQWKLYDINGNLCEEYDMSFDNCP